jgi:hypothetical protein
VRAGCSAALYARRKSEARTLLRKTAKLVEERDHWSRQHDAARAELAGALQANEQISVELNARTREASDLVKALDELRKLPAK